MMQFVQYYQKNILFFIFFVLFSLLQGCFSTATYTTATPIGKGNYELAIIPTVAYPGVKGFDFVPTTDLIPFVGFSGRYGLLDSLDLGFRFSGTGFFSFDSKFNLLNNSSLAISILPSLGTSLNVNIKNQGLFLLYTLPLLLDIKFGKYNILTLSGYFGGLLGLSKQMTHDFLWGAEVSFEFKIMSNIFLQPYFSIEFPHTVKALNIQHEVYNFGIAVKYRIF